MATSSRQPKMKYYTIQPCERLKDFVSHFWISEFNGSNKDLFTYFSTADSCSKLVFFYKNNADKSNVNDREFLSSGIQGQTQTHGQFPIYGGFEIFGVNLIPYSIPYLFSVPTPEISNHIIDLDMLLGQKGKDLNEKMATANNNAQRLKIISDFLEKQLIHNYYKETIIISAIKQIKAKKGLVDINVLSKQCFLSQKQFERKFREWSGFTPKLYSRIVRFEAVLNSYNKLNSLTEIGYACGYYDQSHFIRDFKKFTGYSPTHYFSLAPNLSCVET